MSDRYTAANWYWVVDGNTTQVYSSATAAYVPLSDATYVGWLANGNIPTAIDTEASLQDVLAQQYPAGWPQTIIQQAAAALDAPFCIISTTLGLSATPTYPNGIPFKINGNTQGHINSELNAIMLSATDSVFADGSTSINWPDATTNPPPTNLHTWTVAEFTYFAKLIGVYVSALYKVENGTLTTLPLPYVSDVPPPTPTPIPTTTPSP